MRRRATILGDRGIRSIRSGREDAGHRRSGGMDPSASFGDAPLVLLLDDWSASALSSADWGRLDGRAVVRSIAQPLASEDAVAAALADATAVVAMRERTAFGQSLLARLPNLRLLVTTGSRNAAIDLAAATNHGVTVCATSSASHDAAELAWGLILAAMRGIPDEAARVRRGDWTGHVGRSLEGRTLGVIGLGRHGARVARVGLAFSMHVLAWSTNLTDERCAAAGVAHAPSLEVLLESSDVVTIHLQLSERTLQLIGERELRRMRRDAWLVNTSRGPIVDEAALIQACRDHWIAGAALDVYDQEPLAASHPFRHLPNVIATPHIGYVADASWSRWYAEAIEDIEAWLDGVPIRVLNSPSPRSSK
jgi:phosphoglycerate dehydrogenase-like enzyme